MSENPKTSIRMVEIILFASVIPDCFMRSTTGEGCE